MANLTLPKAARLREKTLACNRQTLPEQARPCEKKASSCNRQTLPEQARPCWKIFALHHSPPCRKTEGGASPAPLPRLLISCRKAFFAFLPSLDGADEGRVAWRFFTSASDQVGALVALASRMGITGFATLYPDEPYGHKMAELFEREGRSAGGINFQQAPYSPKNSSAWVQATASLLSTNKNPESASSATFRAIFLPDSWKNMEVIVPSIHQFGETRQLLLGTTLWEQALKAKVPANIQLYSFAVFPGAWNDAAPSHAASQLNAGLASMGKGRADFWSGLGYDYARFAATFATSGAVNASEINANLMRVNMQWSMGAINWDGSGIAKQSLYLFTPSESGFAPLDEAEFTSRYNSVWK